MGDDVAGIISQALPVVVSWSPSDRPIWTPCPAALNIDSADFFSDPASPPSPRPRAATKEDAEPEVGDAVSTGRGAAPAAPAVSYPSTSASPSM